MMHAFRTVRQCEAGWNMAVKRLMKKNNMHPYRMRKRGNI